MITLQLGALPLTLLAGRAAFLPGSRTLLVADAHVGKAESFRRQGVAVPRGTTGDSLERLSSVVASVAARRIVFLGDLLHSVHAQGSGALHALQRWREAHGEIELTLVRGNHDEHAGDPPPSLAIDCVDEPLMLDGFALCHRPQEVPGAYSLAGHLHPCVNVVGRANDRLRLPCFWIGPRFGVLPAFGAFTGMHRIAAARGDRVFVVAEGALRELPAGQA